jgi:hypothetical protein
VGRLLLGADPAALVDTAPDAAEKSRSAWKKTRIDDSAAASSFSDGQKHDK